MGKQAKKSTYKVNNWADYNQSLVNRGSLTIWINEELLNSWQDSRPPQRGAQYDYSDQAIEALLTLQHLFNLPLRAVQGLGQSLFSLMQVDLKIPHYSTLSRRAKNLSVSVNTTSEPIKAIVMDSTGLKIYGEGEWKVRKHGVSKRRTWRKLHLSIDEKTQQIVTLQLTPNSSGDGQIGKQMVESLQAEPIETVKGDGGYDTRDIYAVCQKQKIGDVVIPPQKNAKIWKHGNCKEPPHPRDENLRYIRKHGRAKWKRESRYHKRSLVETAIYRFKTTFGSMLHARLEATQRTEAMIKVKILNEFARQGLPESYVVA